MQCFLHKSLYIKSLQQSRLFILNGRSRSLFSSFQISIQLTLNIQYKFADAWIRPADLWDRKRPLYQLSHNHCPDSLFFKLIIFIRASIFCLARPFLDFYQKAVAWGCRKFKLR